MAINDISNSNTTDARKVPDDVTAPSATTSATTHDVSVSWTASTSGAIPTTYQIVGTATGGVTVTQEVPANKTSVTMFGQNSDRSYTFAVKAKNKNGLSSAANTTAVTPPTIYKLALTATASTTYTIPAGFSKMASIVYGGGGNGANGTSQGGKGGGGAGGVVFQDYAVSQTQIYTLTVAAAGGQSKITAPDTTIIAAANGGAQGGVGPGTLAGGTGTSQVTSNATITGGAGGGGSSGGAGSNTVGQAGANGSASSFTLFTGYLLPNPISVAFGGGGGGSAARQLVDSRYGAFNGSNQAGAVGGSGGSAGANGSDNNINGRGGAGGGFAAGSGASGGVGRVVIYVS